MTKPGRSEFIDRQRMKLREAGMAGAKIVDREAHAGRAQLLHHLRGQLRLAHDRASP